MYRLNRQNQTLLLSQASGSEAIKARDKALELLRDSADGLTFDPEEHRYFLGEKELVSVTTIVKEYAPFDVQAAAVRASKNIKHEHYGKTPEEILSIWNEKRQAAADAGTEVHNFGEACFCIKEGHEEQMEDRFRQRLADDGLEATGGKEEALARWWDKLDLNRYVLVAKETRIANPEMGYAGTIDLLLYDLDEHCYVLKDYKTNTDLYQWYGKMLRPPLSMIKDNDLGKYTLQQNLYRIQLENIGINVGHMDLIWLKENGTFEEVRLENYDKLVRYAMNTRNK